MKNFSNISMSNKNQVMDSMNLFMQVSSIHPHISPQPYINISIYYTYISTYIYTIAGKFATKLTRAHTQGKRGGKIGTSVTPGKIPFTLNMIARNPEKVKKKKKRPGFLRTALPCLVVVWRSDLCRLVGDD